MRNIYSADLANVQMVDKLARVLRKDQVENIAGEPQGITEGVGRTFFVSSKSSRSSSLNSGLEPLAPYATLQQALNACTANRGDVIYLMAGHTETLTQAITTPAACAGVTIIGLGRGRTRPTFTGNTAATTHLFQVSQADISLRNVVFLSSTLTATSQVDVTGADFECTDCEFNQGASDASSLFLDAGATRAYIHDCTWRVTASGPTTAILINSATTTSGIRIEDCHFHGMTQTNAWTTACISSTVAHLDCLIKNVKTNFGMLISFTSATSTGDIIDAWPGQIGTAGSQIRIGGCALFGGPMEGYLTRVADATLPATGNGIVGTVTGAATGRIKITNWVGQIGTVVQAQANACKLIAHPSAGTDTDLCATKDITGAEAGSTLTLSATGLVATALVQATNGGTNAGFDGRSVILAAGTVLRFNTAATNTGSIKHDTWWRPLDPGASFV